MVQTIGSRDVTTTAPDTTTARPAWPQHARRDEDVVDLRDDPNRPYEGERHEEHHHTHGKGHAVRRTFGFIVAAALLGAVALVAALNRDGEVGIDLGFDAGNLPFWSVIAGAAAFGFVAGRMLDDGCMRRRDVTGDRTRT